MRTRLTHSYEVANIGRIIGAAIGSFVKQRDPGDVSNNLTAEDFGEVVSAACLAHDIGNPPFGHIGEFAIRSWFRHNLEEETCEKLCKLAADKPEMAEDFLWFDGNAQGFRILTKLQGWRHKGGLQLTYATLGTLCKYPVISSASTDAGYKRGKFSFMSSATDVAKKVFTGLGIQREPGAKVIYARHPLSFLMEAADDIAYLTTDVEDGFKAQLISFENARKLLKPIGEAKNHLPRYGEIKAKKNKQDKIAYLRAGAISSLMELTIEEFIKQYDEIMAGEQSNSLLESADIGSRCARIRSHCEKHLYTGQQKIRKEAAGYSVIFGLLDLFGGMFSRLLKADGRLSELNMIDQNLFNLLPEDDGFENLGHSTYETYAYLVDYVSGMTDQFALELFQKLSGHSPTMTRML